MPEDAVLVPGPWRHRDVHAGGARFHVAELGSGPLVLLLHGFPQHWWAWRHQLVALADAGWRAVAMDLRGYGASDKPPHGYDAQTLAGDVVGVVRALGERDAVVVGHDWGGWLGFVAAALHPQAVRRLAVLGIAHPRSLRAALVGSRRQLAASRHVLAFQVPVVAERRLLAHDAALVGRLLESWAAPGWHDPVAVARYRRAAQLPLVARSALEYYRWAVRAPATPGGRRLRAALDAPLRQPVLQLHGELDPCVLPSTARRSARHVVGPYSWRTVPAAGHLLPEEAPDTVTAELLAWLAT